MTQNENVFSKIKVVELATFLAAPTSARFLADLGAEVIKIEGLTGDQLRYVATGEGRPFDPYEDTTWDLENAGKKSLAINLKTEAGKEILFKLLEDADVFVTNWRTDALVRAGIDYDSLKEKYPKLVYAQLTGYGEKGPDKDLPGFDFTAFFTRGGWLGTLYEKGTEPFNIPAGGGDHQAGMFLAAGILAALYRAEKTGKGEKVSVSLFHAAIFDLGVMIQSAQYGKVLYPIHKRDKINPLELPYRTKDDRFIQLAMPPYNKYYPVFMEAIGRPDLKDDKRFSDINTMGENSKIVYDIVKEAMLTKTMAEWKEILTKADIPFAVAQLWEEILEDEQAWANDFLHKMEYPTGNTRTLVRPPVQFREMGLPEYKRGPYLGENSREILQHLGYNDEQIKALLEKKVIADRVEIKKPV
ncbi:MAG TPA: CoA transferase [Firmicutes bacterium]|nr:CoA transferase [Bacillota bacterium]